ncbi:PilW family protein [Caldisalinibacter kiritimatiensis]|uniref:Prepilin peptidase-dependent n=1 Tax=Caldisalinibacter kiritimatiensis TaxID=1304284 RepID=R1AWI7_9FIRM|nr:type II secretion system protein [Caldisalinibacter kiritimatiensis]EOD01523.1 prepilin peptidase-dependent [Caldisalinibacter kiritimatiensis]
MNNIKKYNKGLTLIELIVVIGLIGITIIPVYSFLINNLKNFDRQNVELELQYQAQNAMYYLIDKNMEAKGLKKLNGKMKNEGTWKDEVQKIIEKDEVFAFEIRETEEELQDEDSIYELKSDTNKLFFNLNSSKSPSTEVGNNISNIKFTAIKGTLGDTNGIEIELTVSKDGYSKTIKNTLYFRNKE